MTQFVANDIIDKVLLRDIPSLYVLKRGSYESMMFDGVEIHGVPISDFLVTEGSFSLTQESNRRSQTEGPSETVKRLVPWAMETFRRKPGVPWPLSR
jgi:hypothetical protein